MNVEIRAAARNASIYVSLEEERKINKTLQLNGKKQ